MTERDALRDRVERAVGALFEVEDEIGRGGMAVVYRARDVRLRRKVALKVLPPELAFRDDVKSRFLREAQMSAQLSHPNIVPIFTVDEIDGVVFFAMGLVEGETLAQQLAREPRPSVETVRRLMREVADALAYAHARNVVHRDVKPDNILVDRLSGHALVSDFGIARAAEGDSRLTVTGIAVGTPAYMSPEQAMGEREIDGRADIYSLGIVGYQALAGELPFQAANTPAMLMKHISERPRPLHEVRPDLPENLVYAIERAMGKGRDDRWKDAAAFRDALDEHAPVDPSRRPASPSIEIGIRAGQRDFLLNLSGRIRDRAAERAASALPAASPGRAQVWKFNPDTREYGHDAISAWRREQQRWREQVREAKGVAKLTRRELREARREGRNADVSPEDRIRRAQRAMFGYVSTVGFLFAINMITSPRFPWFVFPALGMGIGLVARISSIWVDGIPLRRLFTRQPLNAVGATEPGQAASRAALPARLATEPDLSGLPREVLDSAYGVAVRDAAEAKAMITDVLAKLSEADRAMLPDIMPTVDQLNDRIRSLAQALHQLDGDASPDAIARLERRIADARAAGGGTPGNEGARRLELLERQLSTLKDLAVRRDSVAQQLESASVVLQTMKLDLLKLRSSGVDARLDASTGATQEARAIATDIERVIDAANEVRRL